jgi:uncharacterized protein YqjF (DUF2071 family)
MQWHDLCFLHWPVDPSELAPLLPRSLVLDTYEGSAWLGVVPFHMTDVSLRGMPHIRRLADFRELNVRTYVMFRGRPGVWFFSLDATQLLVSRIARAAFRLPYLDARIDIRRDGDAISYESARTHLGGGVADLALRYRPSGPAVRSVPGSLEHFLTERYCLYSTFLGRLYRLEVDHPPWPLQPAEVEVERCTMTRPLGMELGPEPPLAHYAATIGTVAWLPRRCG